MMENNLQNNESKPDSNKEVVPEKENIEVVETNFDSLENDLASEKVPLEIVDKGLKEEYLAEKKTLLIKLHEKAKDFRQNIFGSLFQKKRLSIEDQAQYEIYLAARKDALLKNRIFYKGQSLENPREDFWTKELKQHRSNLFGSYGKAGDYLNAIKNLNPEHPLCRIAEKIHALGLINDVRIETSDVPSGFSGYFINVSSLPFKIASGEKKAKDWQKQYVTLAGAEKYFVSTMVHEATHALLLKKLNSPKTAEDRLSADKLYTIYNETKKALPEIKQKQYGFTDLDEFVAEFLTNGEFQKTISEIPIARENLDKNYFENYEIGDFVRIKTRNLVETITSKENAADTTSLYGNSGVLIKNIVAEMLGTDISVDFDDEYIDLETQGAIDLARLEAKK